MKRQENEINDNNDQAVDNAPLVKNITDIKIRRKRISLWKRILSCGI
jgi:hypothetical protein